MLPLFVPTLDLRHLRRRRGADWDGGVRAVLPDPGGHLAGLHRAGAAGCRRGAALPASIRTTQWPVCSRRNKGLDHGHADADPTARQPDALHGAVGAPAAVGVGARGRADRRRPLHGVLHRAAGLPAGPHRQDHVRARAVRRGCRCSSTRWWRPRASACSCSAIRWPMSPPRRRRRSARVFTLLCLVTGSLWGKPMWGAFWAWDPRLTSVLILFFLYLGLIALRSSIEDEPLAGKLTAILAIVGIVILPDHQVLGGLEQHPPAAERLAPRHAGDPSLAAVAAAGDGRRR